MRRFLLFTFVLVVVLGCRQSRPSLMLINVPADINFWAVSAVDSQTAWVSGNKGTVGRTTDGGKTWSFARVGGFEQREFRSLYAFNDLEAVVACVGSPAQVLRTGDGGLSWRQVYSNDSPEAFIDGIDFWNEQHGLIYGDPINGRMLLLRTTNGGKGWSEFHEASRPMLKVGEASFASSGTGIRCFDDHKAMIATGGTTSRIFLTADNGASWTASGPLMRQGSKTGGIFSIAHADRENDLIVGGDFQDSLATELALFFNNGAWTAPDKQPGGTRWCVEYIANATAVAVGPSGADITYESGRSWVPLFEDRDFHVIRKSRTGNLVIVAGSKGKLALLR